MRAVAVGVVVAVGCGSGPAGPRVAVLPEVWATTPAAPAAPASPEVTRSLGAQHVDTVTDADARAALAAEPIACVDDLGCLRRVGQRLGAGKLVTLQLAELGETVAVQLTLVDVGRGSRDATMREMVSPNEPAKVNAALDSLATRVARQTAPPRRSSRAWWWIGAGGIAVSAAAVAFVVATSGGGDEPDVVIVPP